MVKDSITKSWFQLKGCIFILAIVVSLTVLLLTIYVNNVFAQSVSNDTLTESSPGTSSPFESDVNQPSVEDQNQQPTQNPTMESSSEPTTLNLDPINHVVQPGDSITITGSLNLKDSDNTRIEGRTITFDGSGAGESPPTATTNDDGSFSTIITTPNTVGTDLEVKAHFAGDSKFEKSDSNTVFYSLSDPENPDRSRTFPLPDIKLPNIPEPNVSIPRLDYKTNPDMSQLPLWPLIIIAIVISVIVIAISKARGRHRHLSSESSTEQNPDPHEDTVIEIKTEGGLE
jgi:hypothetical protein